MTEDTTPAVASLGQAALFSDPKRLLDMDAHSLRLLAAEVARESGPLMAQIKRMVGLVCWAMRAKMPAEFGSWLDGYSELVGVPVRTLDRWREDAMKAEGITNPYSNPRPKVAGQTGRLAKVANAPTPIPAASTEAPTTTSEGARVTPASPGKGASSAPPLAPSDPSGGHGSVEEQAEDNRTGGHRAARPPALDTDTPGLRPPTPLPVSRRSQWVHLLDHIQDMDGADACAVITSGECAVLDRWYALVRPNKAPVAAPERRQGTVSRPSDRARAALPNGKKPHDSTCSCFGCKPAKAAK